MHADEVCVQILLRPPPKKKLNLYVAPDQKSFFLKYYCLTIPMPSYKYKTKFKKKKSQKAKSNQV